MSQFAYLVNKDKRIKCEAYKIHAGGSNYITSACNIVMCDFLEYCRVNNLPILCVHESWFEIETKDFTEPNYVDFDKYIKLNG